MKLINIEPRVTYTFQMTAAERQFLLQLLSKDANKQVMVEGNRETSEKIAEGIFNGLTYY
ncbi:MAG TPA: hypothetical protein VI423_02990 [Paenisporosarcina sp.]|nr:hypothetical protein [Paenisporosarcina sp.]